MWFQGAAMIWCGGAMLMLAVIALLVYVIVMHNAVVITIYRKDLRACAIYIGLAVAFIFNGLMHLI